MVDVAAIAGALSSLKIANDLVKIALGLRDESLVRDRLEDIRAKIWEAQEHALSAQQLVSTMLTERDDLKRDLAKLKNWTRDKKRYDLVELPSGALAYKVKPAAQGSGPSHHLCPACYHDDQKEIMQPREWAYGGWHLECPTCKLSLYSGKTRP